MDIRLQCVTVDAHDPQALARFWADAIGWRLTYEDADEFALEPPEGDAAEGGPDILFVRVPDAKVAKNRMHFDLRPKDQDAEVARLLALGATHADIGQGDAVPWVVLADPEGNEFCVLRPRPSSDE
jgi:catechol 2,3-dioxygenase-like lactoylglutathione lyase family enzyme